MCGQVVNPIREAFRGAVAVSTFLWGIEMYKQTEAGGIKAQAERTEASARIERFVGESNAHLSELRKIAEKPIFYRLFSSSKENDVKNKDKDSTK